MDLLFRVCMDCENEKQVCGRYANKPSWSMRGTDKAKILHFYDSLQCHLSLHNLGRSDRNPDSTGLLELLFEGLGIHTLFIEKKKTHKKAKCSQNLKILFILKLSPLLKKEKQPKKHNTKITN